MLKTIHESCEYIPITPDYILQLHGILYRYSGRSIGGRFKNVQNYIRETRTDGTSLVRFPPPAPYETPDMVSSICESYCKALDDGIIDPLLLIPVFISDFLCIHPFNDGNGRMSRLLTTLLLYRCGYPVGKYISLESKISQNRGAYYDVLQASTLNWSEGANDPVPFIKYPLGTVLSAYRDFEDRVSLAGKKLSAEELVRNAVSKKIGKFTKNEILEFCPSIKKASVENSLRAMVESGEIIRHGNGRYTFYTRND